MSKIAWCLKFNKPVSKIAPNECRESCPGCDNFSYEKKPKSRRNSLHNHNSSISSNSSGK